MFEKLYYIIAWCDWEKMIIKGYIDTSKYIFQTVLSNTAIKRILVSPSTVYADICQYSKKKIDLRFIYYFSSLLRDAPSLKIYTAPLCLTYMQMELFR